MMKERKLKKSDFRAMFFRSFFIQSTWNYKGLLSIGFCVAIMPVARRLCRNQEEYRKFICRHLNFFNSHPYTASYALGAIARLEEELVRSGETDTTQIEKFKNALIGPLGAVGDQLFWATIKPAVAILAMAGVLILKNPQSQLLFLLVLLILYNVPHLYVRWSGIQEGYRQGYTIYKYLKIEHFSRFQRAYTLLGAVSLGLFCGFYFSKNLVSDLIGVAVVAVSMGISVYARTRKLMVYRTILVPLVLSLIVGILVTAV